MTSTKIDYRFIGIIILIIGNFFTGYYYALFDRLFITFFIIPIEFLGLYFIDKYYK
jgi:hypothetical protein